MKRIFGVWAILFLIAVAISLVSIAGKSARGQVWEPAAKKDMPKVFRKACLFCKDCVPEVVVMQDTLWTIGIDGRPKIRKVFPALYRCQRTERVMEFDSLGVIEWGTWIASCDTVPARQDESGAFRLQTDVIRDWYRWVKIVNKKKIVDTGGLRPWP